MSDQSPTDILIPSEYARLLDPDWREAAIYGGRGGLKSSTVARVLLIRAMQKHGRAGCFREFQNSIADSVHSLLNSVIQQHKLADFAVYDKAIVNKKTGYDFIFRGLHNNVQSIKSIDGMTEAWVEEAQTITENSLEILTPTVRLPGSQIFYTFNRLREKDPIYQRLVIDGRPNTIVINVNYDIALKYGWMADHQIAEMEDDKARRPETYKHKWLGMPSNKKGAIYSWNKVTKIPDEAELIGYGIDFGYTNDPAAVIAIYKYQGGYIVKELAYRTGMKNFEIANVIRAHYGLKPAEKTPEGATVFEGIVQILTVADSAEPKSIADIEECGVTIMGAVKGKDSVNNGIEKLQEASISYTQDSTNIEEEVLNYTWLVNKEDKSLNVPIDDYNHAMDAIRYKITHHMGFKKIEWVMPE